MSYSPYISIRGLIIMGIFDFLFKKKEEVPVINLTKNLAAAVVPVQNEDGSFHSEEFILAKNICPHLKVAGTKYYPLVPTDYDDKQKDMELFLRCRFHKIGKSYVRESLEDQLALNPAVTARSTTDNKTVSIDLINLLKGNIDYVLTDIDEKTGGIFYYFSFKELKDNHGESIEGYLVLNNYDKALVDYLFGLL